MDQFTPSSTETQKVEAYRVAEDARMATLPKHFGRHMLIFEDRVFELMRQFSRQYGGGQWVYFELTNGSFYMVPPDDIYAMTICTNGYQGRMTADAAGVTVCLFAYSLLSFDYRDTEVFAEHFHGLRDFAFGHAEAAEIFAAID
jgi:hypothetical protein